MDKPILHLAVTAMVKHHRSACGKLIPYPAGDVFLLSHKEARKQGIPRRVGEINEVNCRACQKTSIFREQVKQAAIIRLSGIKD